MSARLRSIAWETDQITRAGGYRAPSGRTVRIGAAVRRAVDATRLLGPEPVAPAGGGSGGGAPRVEVTPETSLAAARRMLDEGGERVAVLNFASARNPGGGFLNGARAQEEYLCRHSALYACLLAAPEYYDTHRQDRSPFYTDRVILSPEVPVFRGEDEALLEEAYPVGFLTSPAPNAGVIAQRDAGQLARVPEVLERRAARVLEAAVHGGYRQLVLGAWGCGVFRNDPAQVATAFRDRLAPEGGFTGRFDRVVFAVYDRTRDAATLKAFERVLPGSARTR